MVQTILYGVAAFVLAFFLVYLVYVVVKRRQHVQRARKERSRHPGAEAKEKAPDPAKSPENKGSGHGHGSESSVDWGKVVGRIGTALGWLFVLWIFLLIISGFWHSLFSGSQTTSVMPAYSAARSVNPRPSTDNAEDIRASALAERQRIEAERYVLTLTYGEPSDWIRVPDGGFVTDFTVDGQKVAGVQCGSSTDKPPADASGSQYDCLPGITTYWIRFSAWSAEGGPVTVRYHFRYAF